LAENYLRVRTLVDPDFLYRKANEAKRKAHKERYLANPRFPREDMARHLSDSLPEFSVPPGDTILGFGANGG
jgi:hypothetical protein